MAEFVVRCPQCNTKLQVQDEWGGMEVECAKCKNIFAIPKQDSNTPASPVYTCTQCKKEYSEMTKFCSECGGKVEDASAKKEKAPAKKRTKQSNSPVYICTQCQKEYNKATKFCSECGGKVEEVNSAPPVYACVQCKKEYDETTKFCSECGGKVEDASEKNEKAGHTGGFSPESAPQDGTSRYASADVDQHISCHCTGDSGRSPSAGL